MIKRRLKRIPMRSNPAALVYGAILVAPLLAAESVKADTYAETVAGVALAELVYWLAMSYAEFTGERAASAEPFRLAAFRQAALHELVVVYAAAIPLAVLFGSWIGGVSLSDGLTAGVYTSGAMIVAIELVIGLRSDQTGRELVLDAAVGVVFGLLIVAIKIILR